ncbi:hypothetical protein K439DRAFT_1503084 [Ramaria rubella]|nr:hypothetical protein K439DRAFT_1503084 [Ramaria rubella]
MSMMAPIDYMPADAHSRSASVSSNSSASGALSSHSRPPSAHSQGPSLSRCSSSCSPPSGDDLYHRTPFGALASTSGHLSNTHTRHSSGASQSSTSYSLASTGITSPADSPPATNHTIHNGHGINAIKNQMAVRNAHMRHAARAAASPYARETHSHSGSEAEQDELAMYLSNPSADYSGMYMGPQMSHHMPHPQDAAAASFGRMNLGTDLTLEHLATNVRAATTTSASDRAKQIFVQAWLSANYATYPDGNVPRQGLYFSYRRVCEQYQIPHINTATLGKAIRLCFPTIKTRRLGVRGNSKYHYCGIRPATSTEAEWLQDYIRRSNNHAGLPAATLPVRPSQGGPNINQGYNREGSRSEDEDEDDGSEGASSNGHAKSGPDSRANPLSLPVKSPTLYAMDISDKTPTTNSLQNQVTTRPADNGFSQSPAQIRRRSQGPPPGSNQGSSFPLSSSTPSTQPSPPTVGSNQNGASVPFVSTSHQTVSVRVLPNFPSIEDALGANSSSPQGQIAREVWRWFEDHLDSLLESVRSFRFDQFEMNLRTFWANLSGDHREVVHAPAVAGLMARADAIVYDEILETLRSQILAPIPAHSLTSLRQLADKMEKILLLALENYGPTFVEPKVELGARFGHLVLRFLDIFQVTQALTTVLSNHKQLSDMRRSWNNVDFESVRNQAALVCNCRHEDLVQLLEVDFVKMMDALPSTNEPVRTVMAWADECCDRLMGQRNNNCGGEDRGTLSSRSVLIRWGYVTSQIMRDLTIRSDPAFGAFQILKLFLDDWIALNVLRSVALSTNSVQASVEPVVQQAFFTLSPMAGQESFSQSLDRPSHMSHTPTTSSMLAALNDPFPPNTLDPTAASFNPSSYNNAMSYMDATPSHGDSLAPPSQQSMSFGEFVPGSDNSFDVPGFPQDIPGMSSSATPAAHTERDVVEEPVKEEGV